MAFPLVSLLGPIFPYRGGIAHYTEQLESSLSKVRPVQTISFSRLYPSAIFPGRSCYEDAFKRNVISDSRRSFILDPMLPWTWKKTCEMICRSKTKTVIMPWWTSFLSPSILYLSRRLKSEKIELKLICHNLIERDEHRLSWYPLKKILSHCSQVVVHTEEQKAQILNQNVNEAHQVLVHEHPVYTHFPNDVFPFARRAKLELLFFGFVRPYKQIELLFEAMKKLNQLDISLSIVGEWWTDKPRLYEFDSRIEMIDRYVSTLEAAKYFKRADAIVLPYQKASGSGVLAIAKHFQKPLILSDIAAFRFVPLDLNGTYFFESGNASSLANLIAHFYHHPARNPIHHPQNNNWDDLAARLVLS